MQVEEHSFNSQPNQSPEEEHKSQQEAFYAVVSEAIDNFTSKKSDFHAAVGEAIDNFLLDPENKFNDQGNSEMISGHTEQELNSESSEEPQLDRNQAPV